MVKHIIKNLIVFVATLFSTLSVSYSQTNLPSTTANIIRLEKWENAWYMFDYRIAELEGSGGGPRAAYNVNTDTLRFSYQSATVYQIMAINSVLAQQDLRIGGYNYSWQIYNDLDNQIGTRGSLTGTINFKGTDDNLLESKTFDYSQFNTGANFVQVRGTETFKTSYAGTELGNFEIYWTGKDINNWSGFYGPRVRYVNVQLAYAKNTDPKPLPKVPSASTILPEVETPAVISTDLVKEQTPIKPQPNLTSILSTIRANNTSQQETQKESALSSVNQLTENNRLDTEQLALAISSQSSLQAQQLSNNMLTNRANPLTNIVNANTRTPVAIDSKQESSIVNKLADNNELSGGVDIAAIAVQPLGFNQYAVLTIKDTIFYSPREIYRGQKTVDNAAALRQLASDRLHQQIVDQQWRQP